jgi:hypothetical protein
LPPSPPSSSKLKQRYALGWSEIGVALQTSLMTEQLPRLNWPPHATGSCASGVRFMTAPPMPSFARPPLACRSAMPVRITPQLVRPTPTRRWRGTGE